MPVHRRMLLGASVLTLALLLARGGGRGTRAGWIVASALPNGAGASQLFRVRTTGGRSRARHRGASGVGANAGR